MASSSKSKRTSYEIREEHIEAGAYCIQIDYGGNWIMPGVGELTDLDKNYKWGRGKPANTYHTMERKGFRFTADLGCFAPTKRFTMKSGGSNEKGYQLSFFKKFGFMLSQPDYLDDNVVDTALQLSHRCHRRWCCRLDHEVVETRRRNAARNYCVGPLDVDLPGLGKTRTCGCSLQFHFSGQAELAGPPCLRAWTPSPLEVPIDIGEILKTQGEITTVLTQTGFPFKFRYVVYDTRKEAALARAERDRLKKLKGHALAESLKDSGMVSPDFALSKKARLYDADKVEFAGDPRKLAWVFEEAEEDDDFEKPPPKSRRTTK